jgi:SAM-dependent methyltransferase
MDRQKNKWEKHFASLRLEKVVYDGWLYSYREYLEMSRSIPVVDLGCGTGNDTKYLLERGFGVIACDYSESAMEIIRRNFPEAQVKLFDIREGIPLPAESAQALIADLSIHYFDWAATRKIVGEIHAILRKGGCFLCRVNSTNDIHHGAGKGTEIERNYFFNAGGYKRFFDEGQIQELFASGWTKARREEKTLDRYTERKVLWELAYLKN